MRVRLGVVLFVLVLGGASLAGCSTAPAGAGGDGSLGGPSFAPVQYHHVGPFGSPSLDDNASTAADIDGDGAVDVLTVAPWLGPTIQVVWGKGDGTFKDPGQGIIAGALNSNVIVGDWNADGRPDLASTGASSFTVVMNKGNRKFGVGSTYPLQQSPFQNTGTAADFDRDGLVDIALKTPLGVQVMLSDGDGRFTYGPFTRVPGFPGGITALDDANFNGDNARDLVVTDAATQEVVSLIGDGWGGFTVQSRVKVPYVPSTVKAGDLNGSGFDSVVVLPEVNPADRSVASLLNDGAGNLSAPMYFAGGFANPNGDIGDFNGDGILDVLSVNVASGELVILTGVGDGTFVNNGVFKTFFGVQTPALGDFNGDGRTDISVPLICPNASAFIGQTCLGVLLNTTS
ncbi:MAG: VCBS repeat-containing protein [Acidimicrobiia bacterium]|nr:VCBS repeat-containing protein [Acidimicrobiia bacterium]MBP8180687.1 VCBS repeat-containing protein [Acidimicrobiia bacterium]